MRSLWFTLVLMASCLGVACPSAQPVSYQFPKATNSNQTQADLQEIDDQIRELEGMKRGFVSKALRHEDQAERLQFKDRYYLEARRHMELAEDNRQAAAQIQKEIDRLKQRRRQILEKNGAGDGFEDLERTLGHTLYNQSLALLTDLYQLTMVYGYWKSGCADLEAVFHLNFRKNPFQGGFAIVAGLQTAIEFIQAFRFSQTDLDYLAGLLGLDHKPLFEADFLHFLSTFKCTCEIDAMPEGSVVFPHEPFLRVKGPLWQAQLLESPLLNIINFQTLIATKAARMYLAAAPDPVIEFGMRRAQGVDGAVSASRAAFIGGCSATSDVLAGKLFGIPVRGTHGHSWVMAFDSETEAFAQFANVMPVGCTILIDTYNAIEGVKKAIQVASERKSVGFKLAAVRIDSGDLAALSIEIRKILDGAGFFDTQIMASNELDEYLIRDLKQQGAKITIWGVGTHLVTGKGQSALDGVYKLSAIQDQHRKWHDKLKLSETTSKVTNPGILRVKRWFDGKVYVGDVIYDERNGSADPCLAIGISDPEREVKMKGAEPKDVLVPIFREGSLVYASPSLQQMQQYAKEELMRLPDTVKRFVNPQPYFVGLEKSLHEKKMALIKSFSL